jgi:uridylate kinase
MNFKRILYKISGEVLMGSKEYGQDATVIGSIANDIKNAYNKGIEICISVGGGNIFRGVRFAESGLDRITGDYIGMLATVMNSLALQSAIEKTGIETRIMSPIHIPNMCEQFIRRRALRHLTKGRVLIFAAGTGNPLFTTDTGSVLRGIEMNCDAVLKGTSVDGVYDSDPKTNPDAKKFDSISHDEVILKNLRVMDLAAISMAKSHNVPIYVFKIRGLENPLCDLLEGKTSHTVIK